MAYTHYTLVIPAANKEAVNTWIESQWDDVGTDNISQPLSANGEEPASHYCCGWTLEDARKTALENYLTTEGITHNFYTTSETSFDDALTALGLQRIEVIE